MSRIVDKIAYGTLISLFTIVIVVLSIYVYSNVSAQADLERDVISLQQQIAEKAPAQEPEPVLRMTYAQCESGELRYHSQYTPFTFCYPSRFGGVEEHESSISPSAREGQTYDITFDRADEMRIELRTANYRRLGDTDVQDIVNFDCIDTSKSDSELMGCFSDDISGFERVNLNGKTAFHVMLLLGSLDHPDTKIEARRLFIPKLIDQPAMNAIISYPRYERGTADAIIQSAVPAVEEE
jgi:hypothetical protein